MFKSAFLKSNSESRSGCDDISFELLKKNSIKSYERLIERLCRRFGEGKKQVTIVLPSHSGPDIFLQSCIEPGQASLFSGIRRHRFEDIEIIGRASCRERVYC